MAKDNEYLHKHKHIAIKYGHATFYGDGKPSKELLEALNRMAELAYEQCGGVKVDTGENNALLPDVVVSDEGAEVCRICNGTGYYTYGGSFGGAEMTEICYNCG